MGSVRENKTINKINSMVDSNAMSCRKGISNGMEKEKKGGIDNERNIYANLESKARRR